MEKEKNPAKKNSTAPTDRYDKGYGTNSTPGINTPEISLPAFNPPVPNRAWTAMRAGLDVDELTAEEKRELYPGKDDII